MPDDPLKFAENFRFLRENSVVPPEYPPALVPPEVKEMIAGLPMAEMERLKDICAQTKAFLYLDISGPGGIICGF